MEIELSDQKEGFSSFEMGVLASLHAIKTALQASPGFNNDVLVSMIRHILNNPSSQVNKEQFEAPLLALFHDHVIDENGNVKTVPVSRN